MNEEKNKQKEVIIYSTPSCHYCHFAKDFFQENGIKYTEYNVLTDLEKRQEMIDKSGQMGVPVIMIGEKVLVGFDQAEVSELLEI
jgi:glutaredoxin 3